MHSLSRSPLSQLFPSLSPLEPPSSSSGSLSLSPPTPPSQEELTKEYIRSMANKINITFGFDALPEKFYFLVCSSETTPYKILVHQPSQNFILQIAEGSLKQWKRHNYSILCVDKDGKLETIEGKMKDLLAQLAQRASVFIPVSNSALGRQLPSPNEVQDDLTIFARENRDPQ